MHSLRARLFGLWLLSLAAGLGVALLLIQLYQDSAQAQASRAAAVIARSCDLIRDRYAFYTAHWAGAAPDLASADLRTALADVVGLALRQQDHVEGGIWQAEAGPLSYAFPTYQGSGPKTDLPSAEQAQIAAINARALREQQPVDNTVQSRTQTLLLYACPLPGPIAALTAWTMTRVDAAAGFQPLLLGLLVLSGLLAAMALWLGRTLLVWGRHVRGIEAALGHAGAEGAGMPPVTPTGERELDRIIGALNDAGQRLTAAQRSAETMAQRAARAEHLAGLGRVAAGVAHEIRNPIAAARLHGENALAGDDARRRDAITEMLQQLDRLDGLAGELLAMTQRVTPVPVDTEIRRLLADCVRRHAPLAERRRISTQVVGPAFQAAIDPRVVGRVLDNLMTNAIGHAPDGGTVLLAAQPTARGLEIVVEDNGPGVTPDLAGRLFEPFVTGRADGTGLGLAIAREMAEAHGGSLSLRRAGGLDGEGAAFVLALPQEHACRPC